MRFHRTRLIQPEILDHQPPERASSSLRDLVRINRLLGGHEVLRKCLRRVVNTSERFRLLDIGAGTGDTAAIVCANYPGATVISLDYRLHHVREAPALRVQADAFRLPFAADSFDIVYCSLFLHHFTNDEVVSLLSSMRETARRYVIVNDLERHVLPYYFLPATRWLFHWDPITLHDGPVSVQAAFTGPELRALARRAGLHDAEVRIHRPAFRVSLVAAT